MLARIPLSQLQAQKLIVNQAYENMGLASHADARRHPRRPDAQHPRGARLHRHRGRTQGVRAAVERRDGPWGDYSQAPPERRPDPSHVIEP